MGVGFSNPISETALKISGLKLSSENNFITLRLNTVDAPRKDLFKEP